MPQAKRAALNRGPEPGRAVAIVALLYLALVFAAPSARAADRVVFYPDWFPGPQFAGVYVALDAGYFTAAGLEVEISPFAFGRKTPELIDASPGVGGVGAIEGYIFLQQRAGGAPLMALAAMLQESPAGFMSLEPVRLAGARDFAGRRIGVHKFADPLFRWFVRRAGLPLEQTTMVFTDGDITRLTRGELDAMQGYAPEEFVRLQEATGSRAHFLSFRELGFDSYSEILFTTQAQLARHADRLRRFQTAVLRGWERTLADPAVAMTATQHRLNAPADARYLTACFTALRPFISPANQSPLAPMSAEKWRRMQDSAVAMGLMARAEPPEKFVASLNAAAVPELPPRP